MNDLDQYRRQKLRELSQRTASGRYQTQAERDREAAENWKYAGAGVAGAAGIYGIKKAVAAKVGSLNHDGIRKVAGQLKKVPISGRRILTGGALAEALKKIAR